MTVHAILEFLVTYCSFLWAESRYRITDSAVTESFGDAYLIVASSRLQLRFVRDRGQLFLDVREGESIATSRWYPIDLLQRLLTAEKPRSAVLDENYTSFLRSNLSAVENLFSAKNLESTKEKLERARKDRTKEMSKKGRSFATPG